MVVVGERCRGWRSSHGRLELGRERVGGAVVGRICFAVKGEDRVGVCIAVVDGMVVGLEVLSIALDVRVVDLMVEYRSLEAFWRFSFDVFLNLLVGR